MKNLTSPAVIREILSENSFNFSKSLGQNFLINEEVLEKMIVNSEIDAASNVLEIGPGFGTLTQRLCMHAKKVVSVEIDSTVIPILKENVSEFDNIKIINKDIMKTDISKLINDEFGNEKVKVAANLPYYITTPIIMALIEPGLPVTDLTVMIQKEVAERIGAKPGNKSYGALTVAVNFYAEPEIICTVTPSSFMPQPKVSSAVIRLKMRDKPAVEVKSTEKFFNVVRASFGQRRKTLLNALANSNLLNITKDETKRILNRAGIDEKRRGETLSMREFADIADLI